LKAYHDLEVGIKVSGFQSLRVLRFIEIYRRAIHRKAVVGEVTANN
jgi:hypothetical protein